MYYKDDILTDELLKKVDMYFNNPNVLKNRYTEHEDRYGIKLKDETIKHFIDNEVKTLVLVTLKETDIFSKLTLSDIYLCVDYVGFSIPYHCDDIYKYISCVLYMGDNFSGTTFLGPFLKTIEIFPKRNRLLFFKSQNQLHCVKKSNEKIKNSEHMYVQNL